MHRRRIKSSRQPQVVHKSTGGMLREIPAPVDLVGNPTDLTFDTVALPWKNMGEGIQDLTGRKSDSSKSTDGRGDTPRPGTLPDPGACRRKSKRSKSKPPRHHFR